jgi:Ca2+-binding RTX toxin-like protein
MTTGLNLIGTTSSDYLVGDSGNDTIDGRAGADTMAGGAGDDIYIVNSPADLILEYAGQGNDTVYASVSYTLATNASSDIENLFLTGTAKSATGNNLNNWLSGNTADNVLNGGAGDDTLQGDEGDDSLDGGTGADSMDGGSGNDSYVVDSTGDLVVEAASNDVDGVKSYLPSYTLTANVEWLTLASGTTALEGVGNELDNLITGNTNKNNLRGGAGNDTLDGGIGADQLTGGTGDDTYYIDNIGDVVNESVAKEGVDTIYSKISFSLATAKNAGVENLIVNSTGNLSATGNDLNNQLVGGGGNNTLIGGAGHDTLDGGLGNDLLKGGTGDDYYKIDNVLDVVTELGNEGVDTVELVEGAYLINYTLANQVENLVVGSIANIGWAYGNTLNNHLTGNWVANQLDGGLGSDTLEGGSGDDVYAINDASDVVIERADEGTDRIISSLDYSLANTQVENLTLSGSALVGQGSDVNNVLTGNGLNNLLIGGLGNDTLDGSAGDDTLNGGIGNDTYVVDGATDVIIESIEGVDTSGIDTVQCATDYQLGQFLENLTLTGSSAQGTGNAMNNVLSSRYAYSHNVMRGGQGDDVYVINAGDQAVELDNEGIDRVEVGGNFTLGANVENLTLTGKSFYDVQGYVGTGNALNNHIIGTASADTLNGAAGADTLEGGEGNDVYVMDDTDQIIEGVYDGVDTVQTSRTFDLSTQSNVENLELTGLADINASGNALNNVLSGNAGNNLLQGFAGQDVLDGGAGIDTLIGSEGSDTYVVDRLDDVIIETGLSSSDTDTVISSVNYTLDLIGLARIENLRLAQGSSLALLATGNALNNALYGNEFNNLIQGKQGNDTLDGGTGGTDTLMGGIGDDSYATYNEGDVVVELAGEGGDSLTAYATYAGGFALAAQVESLYWLGQFSGTDHTVAGNDENNRIQADSSNQSLSLKGGLGNDFLLAGIGNDTLDGGSGIDQMQGGTGDDTYFVDNLSDAIVEAASGGTDTVISSLSWVLDTNFENLILIGTDNLSGQGQGSRNSITGNAGNNALSGNSGMDTLSGGAGNDTLSGGSSNDALSGDLGNDFLDGGSGADTLNGGAGDDTYSVDSAQDLVVEAVDNGIDTIVLASTFTGNYTLAAGVENLTWASQTLALTGNDLDNNMTGLGGWAVSLAGGAGNDSLSSGIGNDQLDGGTGADVLSGGEGADTLNGGLGNDIMVDQSLVSSDAYQFGSDSSAHDHDLIRDFGGQADDLLLSDTTQTALDLTSPQIWFAQSGLDLQISVIGRDAQITIADWFADAGAHQIENIRLDSGLAVSANGVQNLVNAMSAFAPSSAQSTQMPDAMAAALSPVLAANWH